jgi:alpha,alpha-trehalase
MRNILLFIGLFCLAPAAMNQTLPSPDSLYGELFRDVQLSRIFPDSKTFPDCIPRRDPAAILADYKAIKAAPHLRFSLQRFVAENFYVPEPPAADYETKDKEVVEHINRLWTVLRRHSDTAVKGSSLLPLPHDYIIPGGRFREIYYWDSYFTLLGLRESREYDLLESMVKNFAYLISRYGHMPNGNRTYYLSRSQPPFFSLMLDILAAVKGTGVYLTYLEALEKEYGYWMDATPGTKHLVRMPDGSRLNRYWDTHTLPRPEAYAEDVKLAEGLTLQQRARLYRNIRSAAESGWDFSSRWMKDTASLASLQTTDLIPVDLNCLLHHMELTLATAHAQKGNKVKADYYRQQAASRQRAVNKWCWSAAAGWYTDYNLITRKPSSSINLAGMFPFFLRLAPKERMATARKWISERFLQPGGLATTLVPSHEQWDFPNGWAPLQWVSIRGLELYGEVPLADTIARRWIDLNVRVFKATGKLMEKYDVVDASREGGGGEYPNQDGFGWTNGVLIALIARFGLKPGTR